MFPTPAKAVSFVRRKVLGLFTVAAALALPAVTAQAQTDRPLELNLALASSSTAYGPFWIALAENLFEKHKVKVNVLNYNAISTGAAMLAAGQIDVFGTNAFAPLRFAQQGKRVSYLMNVNNTDARFWALVAKPGLRSVSDLQKMGSNCRIANLPAGAGHAAYLKALMRAYKLECQIGVVGSPPLLAQGVGSGQYDAAPVLPLDAYTLAEQGKGVVIVDPVKLSAAEAKAIYPYEHPLVVFFGVQERLAEKREEVLRFLGALREANSLLVKMKPEEAARKTAGIKEAFAGNSLASLTAQWKLAIPLYPTGPQAGRITRQDWKDLLAAAGPYWSINDVEGADWSRYDAMVDMTYFDAAK